MARTFLTTAQLPNYKGGLVARMLDAQINRACLDLETAPDVPQARTITLKLEFVPIMEDGELADIDVKFNVTGRQPTRYTTGRFRLNKMPTGQKMPYYEEDAPDNPDQRSLFDNQETNAAR